MIAKQLTFEQLDTFASALATKTLPGDIILLNGDLGTGKTTWSQAFGKTLGIKERIKSPTFNLLAEYFSGRMPLFHYDVYRLNSPEEFLEIGFEHYQTAQGVMLIEWGEIIAPILDLAYLTITLEHIPEAPLTRRVSLTTHGIDPQREKELLACIP